MLVMAQNENDILEKLHQLERNFSNDLSSIKSEISSLKRETELQNGRVSKLEDKDDKRSRDISALKATSKSKQAPTENMNRKLLHITAGAVLAVILLIVFLSDAGISEILDIL